MWGEPRIREGQGIYLGNYILGMHPALMSLVPMARDPTPVASKALTGPLPSCRVWTLQSPGCRWSHFQTRPPVLGRLCLSKVYTEMYLASAHFILISFRRRVINTRPMP